MYLLLFEAYLVSNMSYVFRMFVSNLLSDGSKCLCLFHSSLLYKTASTVILTSIFIPNLIRNHQIMQLQDIQRLPPTSVTFYYHFFISYIIFLNC